MVEKSVEKTQILPWTPLAIRTNPTSWNNNVLSAIVFQGTAMYRRNLIMAANAAFQWLSISNDHWLFQLSTEHDRKTHPRQSCLSPRILVYGAQRNKKGYMWIHFNYNSVDDAVVFWAVLHEHKQRILMKQEKKTSRILKASNKYD